MGVAIDSLDDMAELFDGIPLDRVSTSMTINSTAIILLAMYVALAERQGRRPRQAVRAPCRTTSSRSTSRAALIIYPPQASLRLVTDIFAFCERELPQWNAISVSGYHIREAGSTAVQEVAFTLANGIAYIEAGRARGLSAESLGERMSFFFAAHNDFLEEIAKFRAARRMWARIMKDRFGVIEPARAAAAISRADRRQHAHRAAARQQSRSRHGAGARGRARRRAVAALQRPRRSAGAADRGIGDARASHAANHRASNRASRTRSTRSAARTKSKAGPTTSKSDASALLNRIDAAGGTLAGDRVGHDSARDPGVGVPRAASHRHRRIATVVGVTRFQTDEGATIPTFTIDPDDRARAAGTRVRRCSRVRAMRRLARVARRRPRRGRRRDRISCRRSSRRSAPRRRSEKSRIRCEMCSASIAKRPLLSMTSEHTSPARPGPDHHVQDSATASCAPSITSASSCGAAKRWASSASPAAASR